MRSTESFDQAIDSPQMIELRTLLKNTIALQIAFMSERLEQPSPNS